MSGKKGKTATFADIQEAVEALGFPEAAIAPMHNFITQMVMLSANKKRKQNLLRVSLDLPTDEILHIPNSVPMRGEEWKMFPCLLFLKLPEDKDEIQR